MMVPSRTTWYPFRKVAVCYLAIASASVGIQKCDSFSPNSKRCRTTGHCHLTEAKCSQPKPISTDQRDTITLLMSSSIEEEPKERLRRSPHGEDGGNKDPVRNLLDDAPLTNDENLDNTKNEPSLSIWNQLSSQFTSFKLPPMKIDDSNLLLYDVFLLLNLSVSISFWVVHRMQLDFVALAFNEGCLLSILWIIAGLYHGAFLDSAKDGHQKPAYYIGEDNSEDEVAASSKETPFWEIPPLTKGGPSAAGLLAVNTFINTISLRLIVALAVAVVEHRPVFDDPLEQLIPYEVGFGLVLMSVWRTVHSAYTPRI